MLNYPYMAIYKHIATGLQLHNSPQSNRRYCCIIACSQNYSLHYPRFIACINTSNFMHMDTVGLSRGAPDCSETNFTIISFGVGECLFTRSQKMTSSTNVVEEAVKIKDRSAFSLQKTVKSFDSKTFPFQSQNRTSKF